MLYQNLYVEIIKYLKRIQFVNLELKANSLRKRKRGEFNTVFSNFSNIHTLRKFNT